MTNTVLQRVSYKEYLELAGEGQIVEWVEGEVITYMPPMTEHQNIALFVAQLLGLFTEFFEAGRVIIAPFEVKLWPDGPSREPDVIYIANKNLSRITAKKLEGSPDLLVEIISPSSIRMDRVDKFIEYERAGVREYWIIDPRPHQQQIDFYVLGDDNLYKTVPIADDKRYYSTVIPNFWLNIDWLWSNPQPNTQLCLAEIIVSIDSLPVEIKEVYQTMYNLLSSRENRTNS